ncbi:MAG: nucleoside hydrolase [candidate division Zixibacteria bacterium]|nr:nucleoside hydrolase [candidate division Zixibacteria bacterium]
MPIPRRIILDTDTGVDDALAILLAMRSPELHVEAITAVSGNTHVDQAVRNILITLETLGIQDGPPVARGEEKPLVKPLFLADDVHGGDGLGGVTRLIKPDGAHLYTPPEGRVSRVSAVDLILDLVGRYPDELSLVPVGPLTNVAKAIIKNPVRMRKIREIVLMGGAFRVYGNMSPVAEFNIFVDPHAAQIVCDAGIPLVFVPLDVTMQAVLTAATIDRYAEANRVAAFVRDCTAHYVDFHRKRRDVDGCFLHDPLAVAVTFGEKLVRMTSARVNVETAGDLTTGMTVADLRSPSHDGLSPNARVCVDIDAPAFTQLFTERVLA